MGANVRVGLENSLYLAKNELAPSNPFQSTNIRSILEGLSLEIAAPDEAREKPALKGGDQVAVLIWAASCVTVVFQGE